MRVTAQSDRLLRGSASAREAEAKCDHVWIFEARTLSTASPATMRDVRCIPDGTKVPRTGHIDMRTSGLAPEAACVPQTAQDRLLVGSQLLTAVAGLILV